VGAFARDESVDAFLHGCGNVGARSAADDADLTGDDGTTCGEVDMAADELLDTGVEDFAVDLIDNAEADGGSKMIQERDAVAIQVQ